MKGGGTTAKPSYPCNELVPIAIWRPSVTLHHRTAAASAAGTGRSRNASMTLP